MSADDNTAKPTIKPREDGSLRVEGLENLLDAKGNRIATEGRGKGNIALCRCGHSKSKPFCDGNHRNTDFRSAALTDGERDFRTDYEGDAVTVHDNRGICAHIGYCTDQLPAVFLMGQEPWIDPTGAPGERVAEQTRRCPSGALSHSVGGVEHRDQDRVPTIQVVAAGPYFVTGGVELLNTARGKEASLEHYALCRCGHSKNKPFCDGTHWHVDFGDPGLDTTAQDAASVPRTAAGGDADQGAGTRAAWHKVAELDELPEGRLSPVDIEPAAASLGAAAEPIEKARRPVVIAGYGARDAMDGVVRLADRLNAPVLTTFKAKGLISDRHPLAAGVLGRSGTPIASWFVRGCDPRGAGLRWPGVDRGHRRPRADLTGSSQRVA